MSQQLAMAEDANTKLQGELLAALEGQQALQSQVGGGAVRLLLLCISNCDGCRWVGVQCGCCCCVLVILMVANGWGCSAVAAVVD